MRRSPLLLSILIGASALGLLASVIYVPSLPLMAEPLGTSVGMVQLTMTVYLIAFAGSMLLHGPLSDRFGRRRVLLWALGVCLAATILCVFAPNIEVLLLGRFLQAIGACAGMVIGRATIRDLYDGAGLTRAMSLLSMSVALAPLLAPVLGGLLQVRFGWQANFVFLALFCAALLALAWWRLPETHSFAETHVGIFGGMSSSYRTLLASNTFVGYSLVIGCGAAGFYAFTAGAPVLLIERFGVRPDHYGFYAMAPPFGFIIGSYISSRVAHRVGLNRMIVLGLTGHLLSGGLMAGLFLAGLPGPLAVMGPMTVYGVANGVAMPNAFVGSITNFARIAGAASGLAGFIQMVASAAGTLAISLLPTTGVYSLAGTLAFCGAVALFGLRRFTPSAGLGAPTAD